MPQAPIRSITEAEYNAFLAKYLPWLGATVVGRDGVLEMEVFGTFLAIAKIANRDDFMRETATTLGTVIYLPDGWSYDKKLDVLIHESEHVLQYAPLPDVPYGPVLDAGQRAVLDFAMGSLPPTVGKLIADVHLDESKLRLKGLSFAWLYLMNKELRAVFEAHAYATQMTWMKIRHGVLPAVVDVTERMRRGYDIDAADVATAADILEIRHTELAMGVCRSMAAKKAAHVLHEINPDLLAEWPLAA